MAEKDTKMRVYSPTETLAERELGIRILDRMINEFEPTKINATMDNGKGGSRIRKKDKATGPVLSAVSDPSVDGHEPLLGEAPLGDEI